MFYFLKGKIGTKDILALFFFLLLVSLFFCRFLDGRLVLAFKDLSRYFYPLRYLMVEEVMAGRLPLWNPYIFCGFPLMASLQVGFFYPLTVIHYLLPFDLAFNYYTILHYFLAACFMYALLRHYRLSRGPSFFGGMVFAFSGYLLSVSNMNTSLSSVIWLPLVLLFFDRMIKGPVGKADLVILSFLLAIMFLGGEPTILYMTVWFLLFYGLAISEQKFNSLCFLGFSVILALGLAAVQLLPFIELSRLSDRVVQTGFNFISYRSFPPRELVNFIFPYFFGNPSQFGGYTETLLGKNYQDWLVSPYLGILPLVFIFFAFKSKSRAWVLAISALIALLLAFGKYTLIYRLAYQLIPGIAFIRYPVKYLFLTSFCLCILSAMGLEELARDFTERKEKFRKAWLYLLPVLILSLAASVYGSLFTARVFDYFAHKYPPQQPVYFYEFLKGIIQFNLQSLFSLTAYLSILAVVLWCAFQKRISRNVFLNVVIVVTLADFFANGAWIPIGASSNVIRDIPENMAIIKRDKGLFRFYYTHKLEERNRQIYGENYSQAIWNVKDNLAANWNIPSHLSDFFGYESIRPYTLDKFYRKNLIDGKIKENLKYLSWFNVKYIVSTEKLDIKGLKLLRHKRDYGQDTYLYQISKVFPRAYFLDEKGTPAPDLGEVKIESYTAGRILIRVNNTKPGMLFLADSYYPGWKAYVDGRSRRILLANDLFRAVNLSPGRHEVVFVYDPLSLKIGAIISTFCLLLSAFCLLKSGAANGN